MNPGTILDRYRIVSLLDRGGMGEVYLAEDTTLGRKVALKLLPAELVRDNDRLRRFVQEAKAASALNHPNILTIHEVGQVGETHFLAAEFIDGETLRKHVSRGPLPLREALDFALQASTGLAAAHAAGIVHRDIKPENIMVRRDGYLKIVDFGLAKLTERTAEELDAPTELAAKTGPGVVMGTARYMSPEQARGQHVDARSDIFSLGAVMYETLAGRPAFDGETASHVIVSILEKEPPALSRLTTDLPAEVERIVTKALAKDPDERYQTAKDLAVDLKRLKQRLEVDAELARSTPHQGMPAAPAPRRKSRAIWFAAGITLVAAAAFAAYYAWSPRDTPPSFDEITMTRLTSVGTATRAAISPDGRYVVHVVDDGGQESLWMRQVTTGANVQILPRSEATYLGLAFAPDGDFLFYVKAEPGTADAIYRMPVLGGPPQKVLERANAVSISPDGKRLAFVRREVATAALLMVANIDGTAEREIGRRDPPDFFGPPSWSPDGSLVASAVQSFRNTYHGRVVVAPADGGPEQPVGPRVWYAVRAIAWVSSHSLALIAAEQHEFPDTYQVWSVSYPDGAARRITNGLNNHGGLSVTADGRSLVTVQIDRVSHLWVFPRGEISSGRQVTTGMLRDDGANGLSWAPDGGLVYTSAVSGSRDLWIIGSDGSNPKALTSGKGVSGNPTVCGNSRHVVFTSDREGSPQLWRIGLDGDQLRQIVNTPAGSQNAACSPDGRWIVHTNFGEAPILKVDIEGRNSAPLTQHTSSFPAVSPDGSRIAYSFSENPGNTIWRLAVVPAEGGPPSQVFGFPTAANRRMAWTPDGTALTYVHRTGGVDNLWIQPLAGGPPKQLTQFSSDRIFAHAWSRDGHLALARGSTTSDAVLITVRDGTAPGR